MKAILGKKIGMTQIFTEDGTVIPVTVVEAEPNIITQVKTTENDGYNAIQVGFLERKEKHTNQPLKGHFEKAGVTYKKHLREFRVEDSSEYEAGQEISVEVFEEGAKVDVTGVSKGKGTQGAIKRHNYALGPMAHGSKSHRVAGARSASAYPGRVFKGRAGSGKMGNEKVTVQNLEVVRVDADRNLILLRGAVPGHKGGLVRIKETVKSR